MIFPRHVRSGIIPKYSWAPPRASRKPVITSSKMRTIPFFSVEARLWRHNPHVGGHGFKDHGCQILLGGLYGLFEGLFVVEGDGYGVGNDLLWNARATGNAQGGHTRACLHQE